MVPIVDLKGGDSRMKKLATLFLAALFAVTFSGYAFAQATPATPAAPEKKEEKAEKKTEKKEEKKEEKKAEKKS